MPTQACWVGDVAVGCFAISEHFMVESWGEFARASESLKTDNFLQRFQVVNNLFHCRMMAYLDMAL